MRAFNFQDLISAFVVLFVIIDVMGSLPIFMDLRGKHKIFSPLKASFFSFVILVAFLLTGEGILQLFGIDISSFAVAGAAVLFVIGCEMTFGMEIFKMDGPSRSVTAVPVIFPLLAGPGAITATLSLKAENYNSWVIILALLFNMVIVFLVLRYIDIVEKILGANGVYVLRKFFGIIVLAITVKLFMSNIVHLLGSFN